MEGAHSLIHRVFRRTRRASFDHLSEEAGLFVIQRNGHSCDSCLFPQLPIFDPVAVSFRTADRHLLRPHFSSRRPLHPSFRVLVLDTKPIGRFSAGGGGTSSCLRIRRMLSRSLSCLPTFRSIASILRVRSSFVANIRRSRTNARTTGTLARTATGLFR